MPAIGMHPTGHSREASAVNAVGEGCASWGSKHPLRPGHIAKQSHLRSSPRSPERKRLDKIRLRQDTGTASAIQPTHLPLSPATGERIEVRGRGRGDHEVGDTGRGEH